MSGKRQNGKVGGAAAIPATMAASKKMGAPVGVNPAAKVPIMNPTQASGVEELPNDAVALLVWRKFTGAQPMTIVVTKASWEMNKKVVVDTGMQFIPERIYEFDSPPNPQGRKTTFHLQDVIGWAANVHTGVIPAPKGLKV